MRSFRVTVVPDAQPRLQVGRWDWHELVALACRRCEGENGVAVERTEFIPDHRPRVGETLCCPFCFTVSVVPEKARWG